MILRNSKGFLQMCKKFTLVEQGNVTLREQRNVTIEIIFPHREYYKLQSFAERIPLNFSESFVQANAVLDTDILPPLLLTLGNNQEML